MREFTGDELSVGICDLKVGDKHQFQLAAVVGSKWYVSYGTDSPLSFVRKRNLSIRPSRIHRSSTFGWRCRNDQRERRSNAADSSRFPSNILFHGFIYARCFLFSLVVVPREDDSDDKEPEGDEPPITLPSGSPKQKGICQCCDQAPHNKFPGFKHYFEPPHRPTSSRRSWTVMHAKDIFIGRLMNKVTMEAQSSLTSSHKGRSVSLTRKLVVLLKVEISFRSSF